MIAIAKERPAGRLDHALANYLSNDETDQQRDQRHQEDRSLTIRTDPSGMIFGTFRLPPAIGHRLVTAIETWIRHQDTKHPGARSDFNPTPMDDDRPSNRYEATDDTTTPTHPGTAGMLQRSTDDAAASPTTLGVTESGPNHAERGENDAAASCQTPKQPTGAYEWSSLAQQRADALVDLFENGAEFTTEVVLHVRGDGNTCNDGTPLTSNAVLAQLPDAFLRALIHDSQNRPINASGRQRHPTTRQKRVVHERHQECLDCGATELLEYDHVPAFGQSGRTLIEELELRCAPCHRARHAQPKRLLAARELS